jgi:Spy/CpxP family protein refolding chaperone
MPKSSAGLLLGFLIALPLAAAEPETGAKAAEEGQSLAEFRDGLQAIETDVISKAVSLTTEEATKFWPVFQSFQSEQRAIIDDQIAALQQYASDYASLTDDQAVAYVKALLERDQRIHDLRVKYLAEYSKVLPAGKAARVIHITRRLGLASQAKLASEIPLVH